MDNVIGTCFVIQHLEGFKDPTIYFVRPDYIAGTVLHEFTNPFDAKKKIWEFMESVEVKVSFKKAV